MGKVLYLHGFASSPDGRKVSALRELLAPRGLEIVAPDLNIPSFRKLDFDSICRLTLWEARRHDPVVMVGSSFGALVAIETSRRGASSPLVLIAPALGFGQRWIAKLPPGDPLVFFHHAEEKDLPIHRRFFEQLADYEEDRNPPASPVAVVIGTRDESVPFEHVLRIWEAWEASGRLAEGSRFLSIQDGDHGLVDHVRTIADEIVRLADAP